MIHILIVEDEKSQRELLNNLLLRSGYQTSSVADLASAKVILKQQVVDIIFSDWKLNAESGLDLLTWVKTNNIDVGFILATGHGTISHAVEAMRIGVDDYLVKPYQKDALLFAIEKLSKNKQLLNEKKALEIELTEREALLGIVGSASCMQQMYHKIEKLADTQATVLITGESGTGKELAARALHTLSARKDRVFVAVNCASIPETLADTELFGSEKGAFTGANKQKTGKFEFANHGTIFLDEIGEMPLNIQAKLLRLIQEGVLNRVGSNHEIKINIRIIAATNRNLSNEIKKGNFRADLFYRLNVVPIEMPSLRQHKEDIPALLKHFIKVVEQRHNISKIIFLKSTLKKLMAYSWPGNVRELGNVVERLMLMSVDGVIDEAEIPLDNPNLKETKFIIPENGMDWNSHETEMILQAMTLSHNNKAQAAKLLKMSYKTFLYRLDKIPK